MRALDLTGMQFPGFSVIKRVKNASNDGKTAWLCKCDCGTEWVVKSDSIKKISGCCKCRHNGRARKVFYIPDSGKRLWDYMLENNVDINKMSIVTKVPKGTIRDFLYYGRDISSARLAKMCAYAGISMDYILGLKGEAV